MIGLSKLEIPDLVEPIIAWRCWKLYTSEDGIPILRSPMVTMTWPPLFRDRNYITADCFSYTSRCISASPGNECKKCGIYGYKNFEDLMWDFPCKTIPCYSLRMRMESEAPFVWGKVLLWGKVYEHQRGYRSQFGQVHSLMAPDHDSGVDLETVSMFYQVPIFDQPLTADQVSALHDLRTRQELVEFVQTAKKLQAEFSNSSARGGRIGRLFEKISNLVKMRTDR